MVTVFSMVIGMAVIISVLATVVLAAVFTSNIGSNKLFNKLNPPNTLKHLEVLHTNVSHKADIDNSPSIYNRN